METKIAAQQPYFLPDFHYFYKIVSSDIYCIADFLRFRKQSPVVRANLIDTYLTVPVKHHKSDPQPSITQIRLAGPYLWRQKHLRTLQSRYSSLPFFEYYYPDLAQIYSRRHEVLNTFLWEILCWHMKMLLPSRKIYRCSDEGIDSLQSLMGWFQKFEKVSWLIYPQEKEYYKTHFTEIPLQEISYERNSLFPYPYVPEMPLLVLLFLRGPETVNYFQ